MICIDYQAWFCCHVIFFLYVRRVLFLFEVLCHEIYLLIVEEDVC